MLEQPVFAELFRGRILLSSNADFDCLQCDGDSAKDECDRDGIDLSDEFLAVSEYA